MNEHTFLAATVTGSLYWCEWPEPQPPIQVPMTDAEKAELKSPNPAVRLAMERKRQQRLITLRMRAPKPSFSCVLIGSLRRHEAMVRAMFVVDELKHQRRLLVTHAADNSVALWLVSSQSLQLVGSLPAERARQQPLCALLSHPSVNNDGIDSLLSFTNTRVSTFQQGMLLLCLFYFSEKNSFVFLKKKPYFISKE